MKVYFFSIFRKSVKKIRVLLKHGKNKEQFTRRPVCSFMIYRLIFLRMRNISDKICRGDHNTHFVFNISFFFFGMCAVYEITWKKKLGTARHAIDENIIRRMRFACWITKATNTHLEYVILVFRVSNGCT